MSPNDKPVQPGTAWRRILALVACASLLSLALGASAHRRGQQRLADALGRLRERGQPCALDEVEWHFEGRDVADWADHFESVARSWSRTTRSKPVARWQSTRLQLSASAWDYWCGNSSQEPAERWHFERPGLDQQALGEFIDGCVGLEGLLEDLQHFDSLFSSPDRSDLARTGTIPGGSLPGFLIEEYPVMLALRKGLAADSEGAFQALNALHQWIALRATYPVLPVHGETLSSRATLLSCFRLVQPYLRSPKVAPIPGTAARLFREQLREFDTSDLLNRALLTEQAYLLSKYAKAAAEGELPGRTSCIAEVYFMGCGFGVIDLIPNLRGGASEQVRWIECVEALLTLLNGPWSPDGPQQLDRAVALHPYAEQLQIHWQATLQDQAESRLAQVAWFDLFRGRAEALELASELTDPFNGCSLRGQRMRDGRCSFWSVGANGMDEGGAGDDLVWIM